MSNTAVQQPTVIQDSLSGRREYLDAFDDLIRTYSFLRRLWCRYLFWAVCFLGIRLGSYRRRIVRACVSAYYKTVDRLFGGDRYLRYLKAIVARADKRQAKLQRHDQHMHVLSNLNFELRLLQEAIENPNFVATPHTHQDR
jgi:hypothetical protein